MFIAITLSIDLDPKIFFVYFGGIDFNLKNIFSQNVKKKY